MLQILKKKIKKKRKIKNMDKREDEKRILIKTIITYLCHLVGKKNLASCMTERNLPSILIIPLC